MTRDTPIDAATIDLYLDRVMQSYPYGIAKRFLHTPELRTEQPHTPSVPTPRLVAFIILSEAESLPQQEEELLGSIIEKGLKLPRTQTAVVLCSSEHAIDDTIAKALDQHAPKLLIAMIGGDGIGTQTRRESAGTGATILKTHRLRGVASSTEVKREFWGHLQSGMRVL